MSREFGSYTSGYFWYQIDTAASDCLESDTTELTKAWGRVLEAFTPIAYGIASVEAGDWGRYQLILESIEQLPNLKARIKDVEKFLDEYQKIARTAIERYERERKDNP